MAKVKFYKGQKSGLANLSSTIKTEGNLIVANETASKKLGTIWDGGTLIGDGAANARWYATASMSGNVYTATLKDNTIPFEEGIVGARVTVTLQANSVAGARLIINGVNQAAIRYRGQAIGANQLKAKGTYTFMYVSDGTSSPVYYWDVVGDLDTNTDVSCTYNGHYTPSGTDVAATNTDSGQLTHNSSYVVTGVTLTKDGKGHVTGIKETRSKLPAVTDLDEKVKAINAGNEKYYISGKIANGFTSGTINSDVYNENAYVADGRVFSNGKQVLTDHQSLTNYVTKSEIADLASGLHYEGTVVGSSTNSTSAATVPAVKSGNTLKDGCTWKVSTAGYIAASKNTSGTVTGTTKVEVGDLVIATGVSGSAVTYDVFQSNLDIATTSAAGTVKAAGTRTSTITTTQGGTTSSRYYGVEVDSTGKAFVNVPWTDTNTDNDTKNTTGATNKVNTKLYLTGALTQGDNPVTYTNSNVYIGTDNQLYSNNKAVLTSESASFGNISYSNTATNSGGEIDAQGAGDTLELTTETLALYSPAHKQLNIDIEWLTF